MKEEEIKLRDYFACQVISEFLKVETDDFRMLHGGKNNRKVLLDNAAKLSYEVADAMMYVRNLKLDK